jgi:hypothetical protein
MNIAKTAVAEPLGVMPARLDSVAKFMKGTGALRTSSCRKFSIWLR